MITKKLKLIFGISIPVFILHGIEEFVTHFSDKDAHAQAIFGMFSSLSNHGATFVVFQIMFWLLLIISLLLIMGGKWQLYTLGIAGIVYIYELHHVYKAIAIGGYYPGLYTSIAFPIIGFFFWKEWLAIKKQNI
ncbi:MAG: HXXEE domain-containing protein [bacterium]|nr:HXXEE domain-containing protein [bacterium]